MNAEQWRRVARPMAEDFIAAVLEITPADRDPYFGDFNEARRKRLRRAVARRDPEDLRLALDGLRREALRRWMAEQGDGGGSRTRAVGLD